MLFIHTKPYTGDKPGAWKKITCILTVSNICCLYTLNPTVEINRGLGRRLHVYWPLHSPDHKTTAWRHATSMDGDRSCQFPNTDWETVGAERSPLASSHSLHLEVFELRHSRRQARHPSHIYHSFANTYEVSQIKHQLDATLCRFYFCRVTLHVSGVKRPSSGVLKNWHCGPWYRCYSCR